LFGVIKIRQEPKMKAIAIFTLVIWCVGVESLPGVREKREEEEQGFIVQTKLDDYEDSWGEKREMKECSSIVQSFHRRRYQVFYKGRGRGPTWQESRKACQALGGDLAEFKNRQEQDKIENAIIKWPTGRYAAYWIGIEKGSGEDAVWISGEKVEFNSDLMFSSFNTLHEKSTRDKFGVIDREGIRDSWGFWTAGYVCEFASNESMDEGVEICNIDNDDHNDNEDNNNKEDNSDNEEPLEWARWMLEDNNDNNEDNSNNEDNNNNKDNYVNEDPIVITYSYDLGDNNNNNNYEDNKTQ